MFRFTRPRPVAVFDFLRASALDPRITFARASVAWDYAGKSYASGAPRLIPGQGLLMEAGSISRALQGRDLTQSVWTKTGATAALDQVGLDGVSNAGSSLTATAANGTVTQAISDGSSRARNWQVYLKRLVGTGSIALTLDGSTWTDVTAQVGSAYALVAINTTSASPTIGIRLGTSSDKIAVDFATLSDTLYTVAPIAATTVNFSRLADLATIPLSAIPGLNARACTIAAMFRVPALSGTNCIAAALSDGTSSNQVSVGLSPAAAGNGIITVGGGSIANIMTGNAAAAAEAPGRYQRIVGSFGPSGISVSLNGGSVTRVAAASTLSLTTLSLGSNAAAGNGLKGYLARVALYEGRVADALLPGLPA